MFEESAIFSRIRNLLSSVAAVAGERDAAIDAAAALTRGNELLGEGRLAESVDCYRQAVAMVPRDASAHISLGYGLFELGELEHAQQSFAHALELDENLVDGHFLLGRVLVRQGRPGDAANAFERALALKPDFVFCRVEYALLREQAGDAAGALQAYSRAFELDPSFAGAAQGRSRMLLALARWQDALDSLAPQLGADADAALHVLQARALHGLGRGAEALALLDAVLSRHPDDLPALTGKAGILTAGEKDAAALEVYRHILALEPRYVEALTNAGAVSCKLGLTAEALAFHERAAAIRPHDAVVRLNMMITLQAMRRFEDAIAVAGQGLIMNPGHADLHYQKASLHLLLGQLRQGWQHYEARWDKTERKARKEPVFGQPMWQGESVAGKVVLLYSEQGLGDTLQMLRYVPLLAARGAKVLLVVQQAVFPLCGALHEDCVLIDEDGALPDHFDYRCPLMSLPMVFDTGLDTIPQAVPYIHSDAAQRSAWESRLGPRRGPRVGLVWSGNPEHPNDANRSIPLKTLLDSLPPHVQLVSLQKEVRAEDRGVLQESRLFHAGEALQSFADTAALTDCMDLVISVDTSVAHLAGALGKPFWVLLAQDPDWRWLLDRDDSPWYPTARLFRQPAHKDWASVMAMMAEALEREFPRAASGQPA